MTQTNATTNRPEPRVFKIRQNGSTYEYTRPISDFDGSQFNKMTAAVVRQILEQGQEDLRKYFGDYHWYLQQVRDGYEFVAAWNGQVWVEGRGKTPRAALLESHSSRAKFRFLGWMD